MAFTVMAHVVMAYLVMAYIVMAYIVVAYIVMAHIVMAYIVFWEPVGCGQSRTLLALAGCVERGAAGIIESRHALRQLASHVAVHAPTWFARSRPAP